MGFAHFVKKWLYIDVSVPWMERNMMDTINHDTCPKCGSGNTRVCLETTAYFATMGNCNECGYRWSHQFDRHQNGNSTLNVAGVGPLASE